MVVRKVPGLHCSCLILGVVGLDIQTLLLILLHTRMGVYIVRGVRVRVVLHEGRIENLRFMGSSQVAVLHARMDHHLVMRRLTMNHIVPLWP